jgi:trans-2,3-dihydro-3-hydroxyanthranilate isomerase
MERRYSILNVFTTERRGGNPLAVVTDAEGLSSEAMQAIAHKFNLSETVFVLPPKGQAHTAAIRIFTPEMELPFAGHPAIGTAVLLARHRIWRQTGEECDALVVLEAKAGVLRIGVKPGTDGAAFAQFDAPFLPQEADEAVQQDRIATALSLAPHEIGFENHRPSRFRAGVTFTFVPIDGLDAIGRAKVVEHYWEQAFGSDRYTAAYLYCRDTVRHKSAFHARVFAPSIGMPEDPATGSAAVALAGVIQRFDEPPEGSYEGYIEQGLEMGQPCELYLEFEVENRQIRVVRIGGEAVVVEDGSFEV